MTRKMVTTQVVSLCFMLVACSGAAYDPGSSPSSVNLPTDATIENRFKVSRVFPKLTFDAPLLFSPIPDENRLLVVEQGGRIFTFDNDANSDKKNLTLNMESKVLYAGEQGLLGLAFDPNFTGNRFVYLYYSADNPKRSVIARMFWDPASDTIDPASEKTILEIEQPYANHNGGMIEFGPDDYLYIGTGDGGSGGDPKNHAQNRSTLLGNILRLDVHPDNSTDPYAIPADNPFQETPTVRPEIYAYGLRNPFRFSFDRVSGDLWVGDVGQNAVEEINRIESGGNYGWRVFEGSQLYDGSDNNLPETAFSPPVFEYPHSAGVSVTGGYVYHGHDLPSLQGRYLFADFGSGQVWALTLNGANAAANTLIANVTHPTAFGEMADGELVIVSRSGGLYLIGPQ